MAVGKIPTDPTRNRILIATAASLKTALISITVIPAAWIGSTTHDEVRVSEDIVVGVFLFDVAGMFADDQRELGLALKDGGRVLQLKKLKKKSVIREI